MEWQIIVVLAVMIPVLLTPVALVLHLKFKRHNEARERPAVRRRGEKAATKTE
ncbi:MAG: hypothetical protein QGI92_04275 [Dehalococcoidales bacterium]|jgi:hypothetical protein|nr:hypothetical protein [Dehalococcoidales bacterium]MDP7109421.1 hypothetical protein [Dehalococcoidales bacterium]MDP7309867.1 hypothetical protein [Dehalococcoidales bacterium]MDP7409727.1 hypothetical protein [Dehalococcoidales bacterium]MDP7676178.1 hypothetical protein [Dehalococcoidales bacterium]